MSKIFYIAEYDGEDISVKIGKKTETVSLSVDWTKENESSEEVLEYFEDVYNDACVFLSNNKVKRNSKLKRATLYIIKASAKILLEQDGLRPALREELNKLVENNC